MVLVVSNLALFSFFHFIRRFWNQILIWRSVRHRAWAISIRLLRVRYRLKWNSFSSSRVWYRVYVCLPRFLSADTKQIPHRSCILNHLELSSSTTSSVDFSKKFALCVSKVSFKLLFWVKVAQERRERKRDFEVKTPNVRCLNKSSWLDDHVPSGKFPQAIRILTYCDWIESQMQS